jgi:hypothetical protein
MNSFLGGNPWLGSSQPQTPQIDPEQERREKEMRIARERNDWQGQQNNQVDILNQMMGSSQGNQQMQMALLGQYLSMMGQEYQPKEPSRDDLLQDAMFLMSTGDPRMQEQGNKILMEIFGIEGSDPTAEQRKNLGEQYAPRFLEDFGSIDNKNTDINARNSELMLAADQDPGIMAELYGPGTESSIWDKINDRANAITRPNWGFLGGEANSYNEMQRKRRYEKALKNRNLNQQYQQGVPDQPIN